MAAGSDTETAALRQLGKKQGFRWPHIEKKYTLGKLLGQGNFAKVYLGTHKKENKTYALKIVEKSKVDLQRLAYEIQILETLKHDHIMGFKECVETKTKVVLVCELVSGGELFDRILKKGAYSETEAATVIRQLLTALEYAHSKGVIHRDLKPENLLLASSDNDVDIKISDFGLAKMLDDSYVTSTLCGTPMYVAPELLSPAKRPYGPRVDVWAVGVITFILLGGYPPFYNEDLAKLYRSIVNLDLQFDDEYWEHISPTAIDFISHLLVLDPEERPDATQALTHPWLQEATATPLAGSIARLKSFVEKERQASQARLATASEENFTDD